MRQIAFGGQYPSGGLLNQHVNSRVWVASAKRGERRCGENGIAKQINTHHENATH
jgi:hypothetical protein